MNSYVSFYEYNELNRLIKTITKDKGVTYKYNGEGLRVEKDVNGETTRYLYEGNEVILEVDGLGNQTAKNVHGTSPISRTVDGEKLYYLYNGNADVTSLIDSNGAVVATYYYDAFGNPTETTGEVNNPYRYAGYQYDEETGNYYLRARYYNPKIARFITEDTFRGHKNDPLTLNLYTYGINNPIKYYDPSGHYLSSHDKKYLSKDDKKKINKYTKEWKKYDDALKRVDKNTRTYKILKNLRDKEHNKAEDIRAKKDYSGGRDGSKYIKKTKKKPKSPSKPPSNPTPTSPSVEKPTPVPVKDTNDIYEDMKNTNDIYKDNRVYNSDNESLESSSELDEGTGEAIEQKGNTRGVGAGVSAHALGGVDFGRGVYWDEEGNIAILRSKSVTITTDVEVSGNVYYESAKDSTVYDLLGTSVVAGAGGEIPYIPILGANHEKTLSTPDSSTVASQTSVSANFGFSPVEVHTGLSDTELDFIINMDTLKGEYNGSIFKIEFDLDDFEFKMRCK